MTDSYQKLQELMKFPNIVDFRIIVTKNESEPLLKLKEVIDSIEENGMQEITAAPRPSRNGNYISYTVPVKVTKADHLKKLYEKISVLAFVKHVL